MFSKSDQWSITDDQLLLLLPIPLPDFPVPFELLPTFPGLPTLVVGEDEGRLEGCEDGFEDGWDEGPEEGMLDGCAEELGAVENEGFSLGMPLGTLDGMELGWLDGIELGWPDGIDEMDGGSVGVGSAASCSCSTSASSTRACRASSRLPHSPSTKQNTLSAQMVTKSAGGF